MSRKALVLLLAFLAAFGALLAWLTLDDAADPQAAVWLDAFEQRRAQPSDSYLLLLGLDAAASDDPLALGEQRLQAYQQWLADGEKEDALQMPDGPGLPTPDQDVVCDVALPACLARSADDGFDIPRLLSENAVLLERYRRWLELAPAQSQAVPGASEPIAPFTLLLHGNRLLGLQALALLRENPHAALDLLQDDIVHLRRQLASSDTLIMKMVVMRLIGVDLERIALLHARGLLPAPQPIAPLSERERSLLLPMQHEFAGSARLFGNLRTLGEPEHGAAPLYLLFKPQRTINAALRQYAEIADLSALDSADLPAALERMQEKEMRSPWQEPTNPIGQILLNIAGPAYEGYVGRLHDLDARIRLFNLLGQLPGDHAQLPAALATLPGADNPYYPGQPPRWDAKGGRLCFDGPLKDSNETRCLPLR